MPFPFYLLCELLNELDRNRAKSLKPARVRIHDGRTIVAWFNRHDHLIPREGPEAVAFLSCLFPDRGPDRVFNLQEKRLESTIQQAQCLGATRMKDFASSVEYVMAVTDEHGFYISL